MIQLGSIGYKPAMVELPRPSAASDLLWVHSASTLTVPQYGELCGVAVPANKLFGGDPLDASGFACAGWQGYSLPLGTVAVQTDAIQVRLSPARPQGMYLALRRNPTTFTAVGDKQLVGPFFTGRGGVVTFNAAAQFTLGVYDVASGFAYSTLPAATSGQLSLPVGGLVIVVLEIHPASVPYVGAVTITVGVAD